VEFYEFPASPRRTKLSGKAIVASFQTQITVFNGSFRGKEDMKVIILCFRENVGPTVEIGRSGAFVRLPSNNSRANNKTKDVTNLCWRVGDRVGGASVSRHLNRNAFTTRRWKIPIICTTGSDENGVR